MDVTAQTAKQFVEQDKVPLMIGYTDTDSVLGVRPDLPVGEDPVHHGRRDVAQDPDPGRRHDVPGLLRRQRPGRGRRRVLVHDKFGKNAYFLWDKGVEYTTLLGQYFKTRFTELGGTIALEDSYDDKATDFSAQITKIKALSPAPDFYYVAAMPYNIGPLVKQFRDAGLDRPRSSAATATTRPTSSRSPARRPSNVFFTTHALMDATARHRRHQEVHRRLQGRVRQRSGERVRRPRLRHRLPPGRRDQARGRHRFGGRSRPPSRRPRTSPGITGKITFSPDSHVPQKGVTVIDVENGALTLGGEVVPDKVPAP